MRGRWAFRARRALRVEGLLTLEDIGGLVGVNKTAVSKWERGVCLPAVQYVVLLCDLFDVTVEWLLEGRGRRSRRGGANG